MKQIYFLFLIALFGANQMYAQPCPEAGGAIQDGNTIVFYYPNNPIDCASMPATLTVRDNITSNTSTFSKEDGACSNTVATYTLRSGGALSGQGFVVESGFTNTCSYSGGTLPVEAFEAMGKDLKVYPSPVFKGNEIELAFGFSTTAKIEVFNITGKLVLTDSIEGKTSKIINISGLSNGLYLVKIGTDYTSISRKIVISK
ncbi:T9SS type A sorting domain-containing protein [Aestuariibaculum lutulentum]|uniref:T9SS type A sorting domain-containing protein n=1 Tax=Aestuariibaculum lutulentum TaxID=2920935 RepID=A0ABS9RDJ4_9FLAO|nr:T9SS type A sorting domain-containing protein [Aestuariibaculum lutulentum]MCH4551019.1 T9SS type A sorting domain-containing protein [Aestuariibaculum lutulentum]